MRSVWEDVRFGTRLLGRTPAFTLAALLTLALGIGANTALLSYIDAIFLRPLAATGGAHLVHVHQLRGGTRIGPMSLADYFDYRQEAKTFADMSAHYPTSPLHVIAGGEPLAVNGSVVTASYFRVLGIEPALGRFFGEAEDTVRDRDAVAVISDGFWRQRFDASPRAIGQTLAINGRTFTVVGVAPPGFGGVVQGGGASDIWIPSAMLGTGYRYCRDVFARDCTIVQIFGRLRPGVSIEDARAELAVIAARLERSYPATNDGVGAAVVEARGVGPDARNATRRIVLLLLGGVALVLLVACANVAGLLLVRGVTRRREVAVRLALGATRRRVVRQLLTETALLAVAGGALGLLVAVWANDMLRSFYAADYAGRPVKFDLDLRGWVVAVTAGLSLVTALLCGLAPALLSSATNVVDALKDESGTGARRRSVVRDALVVLQIACSLVLLAGAGLLVRSLHGIAAGPGIDASRVVMLRLRPSLVKYDGERAHAFQRAAIRSLESVEGVVAASAGESLPMFGAGPTERVTAADGRSDRPAVTAGTSRIGDRYFEVLGVPMLEGRAFDSRDQLAGQPVAILNDVLAQQLWPGERAVGRQVRMDGRTYAVVGVVRGAQYHTITESVLPYLFLNYWQLHPDGGWSSDSRTFVRVDRNAASMMPAIRRAVAAVDPAVPVSEAYPLETRLTFEFSRVRMAMTMLSGFGVLTLVLTAMGLYGVVAFAMSLRMREIAIRMALGARPAQVRRLVLGHGMKVAAAGAALGLAAALAGARLLSSLLHGVSPYDAATFAAVALVLSLVALSASGLPARRAMRVDPALTLRRD